MRGKSNTTHSGNLSWRAASMRAGHSPSDMLPVMDMPSGLPRVAAATARTAYSALLCAVAVLWPAGHSPVPSSESAGLAVATTAAVSTGGMYSFSGTGIPSGNALLIQPGGNDWAPGTLTFRSQNTGSAAIDPVISYDLYVRNDQSRSNSFNFSFSTDNINYTSVAALNYTSPAAAVGTAITFVSRWQPF